MSMTAITLAAAAKDFPALFEQVVSSHEPVVIKKGRKKVRLVVEEEEERDDTTYLMSSPETARRLTDSISRLNAGQGIIRDLDLNT